MITAVVDTQTNEFLEQGKPSNDLRYIVVGPLSRNPEPSIERYSGNISNPFLAKTSIEIADEQATTLAAKQLSIANVTSRQKDILSTIAWAIRFRNVSAWNALTLIQKRTSVLAEADNWRDIRIFVEQNF